MSARLKLLDTTFEVDSDMAWSIVEGNRSGPIPETNLRRLNARWGPNWIPDFLGYVPDWPLEAAKEAAATLGAELIPLPPEEDGLPPGTVY